MTFPLQMPNSFFQIESYCFWRDRPLFEAFEESAIAITGKVLRRKKTELGVSKVDPSSEGALGFAASIVRSSCQPASCMLMSSDSKTFTVLVYILRVRLFFRRKVCRLTALEFEFFLVFSDQARWHWQELPTLPCVSFL